MTNNDDAADATRRQIIRESDLEIIERELAEGPPFPWRMWSSGAITDDAGATIVSDSTQKAQLTITALIQYVPKLIAEIRRQRDEAARVAQLIHHYKDTLDKAVAAVDMLVDK